VEAYIISREGERHELPVLLSWEIIHSIYSCDAFEISTPLVEGLEDKLYSASEISIYDGGKTVFRGVIDEYELIADHSGAAAVISGRGFGARLMDNEAESAEYHSPAIQQILDKHVYPFGISRVRYGSMECTGRFPVSSGQSQWKVLRDFCFFSGGIIPRFDREGQLILDGGLGETVRFSRSAITEQVWRDKRYGVFSQVLVKNPVAGTATLVENPDAVGRCRRVITVPRYTRYDRMRYTGQYQIEQSKQGSRVMLITTPIIFAAFAGDRVELEDSPLGISGRFIVTESRCTADGRGAETRLELIKEE